MWEHQQHHAAPRALVMEHLGYTAKSGAGTVTYGAVKRFGLLDDSETGRVHLSPLGLEIVRGEQTGQRNYDKLREAALRPPVHAEMWEQYGAGLPADSMVEFDLVQRGFTKKGATDFLAQWKRTMEFARLADTPDTVPSHDGDNGSEPTEFAPVTPAATAVEAAPAPVPPIAAPVASSPQPQVAQQAGGDPPINIPVGRNLWATLSMPSPMTVERWDQMMAVLTAMKPALVSEQSEPAPAQQSDND